MAIIKTFEIGFWTGNDMMAYLKVDGSSKKDAEDLAKEMRDALMPLLDKHYHTLGIQGPRRLKIFVT